MGSRRIISGPCGAGLCLSTGCKQALHVMWRPIAQPLSDSLTGERASRDPRAEQGPHATFGCSGRNRRHRTVGTCWLLPGTGGLLTNRRSGSSPWDMLELVCTCVQLLETLKRPGTKPHKGYSLLCRPTQCYFQRKSHRSSVAPEVSGQSLPIQDTGPEECLLEAMCSPLVTLSSTAHQSCPLLSSSHPATSG